MKAVLGAFFLTLSTLVGGDLWAVKPGEVSRTASAVCEYRAIAAQHPDPRIRNPDVLAERLCPRRSALPRTYAEARRYMDNIGDSYAGYFFVNARTHYIDAALRRAAAEGVTQVVIMGAGFDSRAYRFRESHPELRFFEVDLPAMSEAKKARLVQVLGALPEYVRYAPIDFNTQRLQDVLPPLGYDARQRTFFVLEGVVMYVAEGGIRTTFEFIRAHSAPGSRVVYDYVLRRVVDGKVDGLHGAGTISLAVAVAGEPYVSGWSPREAQAFAKRAGLAVLEDVGDKVLTQRHLLDSAGRPDGRMTDWQRILLARVP